jgi:sugar fermentation stimulation protein A
MSRFFPEDVIKAVLIHRPNRFVVKLMINEQELGASLPNPGKLGELFIPGAVLYVHKMREEVKYPLRVIAVESFSGEVIMLDTHTNNRIAEYLIDSSLIPSLNGYTVKRREVTVGHSRFDLLLENRDKELLYCEVKSCTLFGCSLAMFPDAVTSRGKRHIEELSAMSDSGIKTAVVFVIQSLDIQFFVPDYHTDPDFSETLYKNRNKIKIIPIRAGWNDKLEIATAETEVPILWDLYNSEGVSDRGSYIMLFFIEHELTIEMGDYGKRLFQAGYYAYVAYEKNELKSRIERHKRKRKRCNNQRDFLRNNSKIDMVWPIRASVDDCCRINRAVKNLADNVIENFDSLFCNCDSHLHFFKKNPRLKREFQEMILDFRMRFPLDQIS